MNETITATLPLKRWQGDRGTYHLVTFEGDQAEAIAMHDRLHRLEFGRGRGFGSIKVIARIGETEWKSSVFPQNQQSQWVLLISKKVMKLEGLSAGDPVNLSLDLL